MKYARPFLGISAILAFVCWQGSHPGADDREVRALGAAPDAPIAPPPSQPAATPAAGLPAGLAPDQWASIRRQMEAEQRLFRQGADGVVRSFSPRGGELLELEDNGTARVRLRGDRVATATDTPGALAPTAVVSAADARPDAVLEFKSSLIGRAGSGSRLQAGRPRVDPDRVSRDLGHGVEEWWRSEEQGFELGWTVSQRPVGDGPLELEVSLQSPWPATARPSGRAVDVLADDGSDWAFRCANLIAYDATGKNLPARMAVGEGSLRITVDDPGAKYPVVIDPWIFTELRSSLRSNAPFTGARFGATVAACGDVVVTTGQKNGGSASFDGEAYIFSGGDFRRMISGVIRPTAGASAALRWISVSGDSVSVISSIGGSLLQTTVYERHAGGVEAWGPVATIPMGETLSYAPSELSGEFMAIALPTADPGGIENAGQVQIRRRDAGGPSAWGQVAALDAGDEKSADAVLGIAQVLEGGTLVAVAMVSPSEFELYFFDRLDAAGTQWVRRKIVPLSGGANGLPSLSLQGDTLAVGFSGNSVQSARVYERHLGGLHNWGLAKTIAGPPGEVTFGYSVSLLGSLLAIGCPKEDVDHDDDPGTPLAVDGGSIRFYSRTQGGVHGWGQVERIKGTEANANVGVSADFDGDQRLYFGQPIRDLTLPNMPESGVVVAHQISSGEWARDSLDDPSQNATDWGGAVDVSGPYVLVGAPRFDGPSGVDAGWAFLFKDNVLVKSLLPPGQQAGERFGAAVAIDGDRLVVGSPLRSGTISPISYSDLGAVTVFERNQGGADNWGVVKSFSQPSIGSGSVSPKFGSSLALAGDVLAVGGPEETGLALPGAASKGRVRVFYRNAGGVDAWGQIVSLRGEDNGPEEFFGTSVDLSGDTLVVGAPWEEVNGLVRSGAAYLHRRNQGGADAWGRVRKLTADTVKGDAWFGHAVAIDGMDLVVGAPHEDRGLEPNVGAIYFFAGGRTEADAWAQTRRWQPDELETDAQAGYAVDVSDGTAVIGAPTVSVNEGSVFFVRRNRGGADAWGPLVALSGGQESLGESVAIDGGLAVVGEPRADITDGGQQTDRGRVLVYELQAAEFTPAAERVAPAGAADFGSSVAVSQNWLAVGAPGEDVAGVADAGAVYMFHRDRPSPGAYGFVQKLVDLSEGGPGSRFGAAIAMDAHWVMAGMPGAGRIQTHYLRFLPHPSPDFMWVDSVVLSSGLPNSLGASLALDEGFLVAGAPAHTAAGQANAGAAYVFERNQSALNEWGTVKILTAADLGAGDALGTSVAISRGVAAVGAPLDNNGEGADAGAVYLFARNQGGAENWGQLAKVTNANQVAGDELGHSVALLDGLLLVGAPKSDFSGTDAGLAFLFERNKNGADAWGLLEFFAAPDPSGQARFGTAVAVDSEHAFVSAPFADPRGLSNAGAVHVFGRNWLAADAWLHQQSLAPTSLSAGAQFGHTLALHDGVLAVAAPGSGSQGRVTTYEFSARRVYQEWADAHGLEGAWALPGADADGDSQPNLLELVLGSHPRQASSQGRITLTRQGNALVLTAAINGSCPAGLRLTAEASTDLASWAPVPPQDILADSGKELQIQLPFLPGGTRFARFRAEMP